MGTIASRARAPITFTAEDRAAAARICETLAADREACLYDDADAAIDIAAELGASARAVTLALAGSRAVPSLDEDREPLTAEVIWASAAAALRGGWEPGLELPEVA